MAIILILIVISLVIDTYTKKDIDITRYNSDHTIHIQLLDLMKRAFYNFE